MSKHTCIGITSAMSKVRNEYPSSSIILSFLLFMESLRGSLLVMGLINWVGLGVGKGGNGTIRSNRCNIPCSPARYIYSEYRERSGLLSGGTTQRLYPSLPTSFDTHVVRNPE